MGRANVCLLLPAFVEPPGQGIQIWVEDRPRCPPQDIHGVGIAGERAKEVTHVFVQQGVPVQVAGKGLHLF